MSKEIELLSSFLKPRDAMLEWGRDRGRLYSSKLVKGYCSISHNKQSFKNYNDFDVVL